MNWLLILVIAFLAFCMVRGYKKGILRMIYSLVSWVVILIIVIWATPYVNDFLVEKTSIDTRIEERSKEQLSNMVKGVDGDPEGENNQETLAALGLKLPEPLVKAMFGEDDIADSVLEKTGLYDTISHQLSTWAMKGIAFLITLIVIILLFRLLLSLIKLIEDAPVIGTVNHLLGILLGAVKGLVILWVLFAIIAMNAASGTGLMLVSYIYESKFLTIIYENNLVLTIILMIVG